MRRGPLDVHPELQVEALDWASHLADTGILAHSALTDGITAAWLSLGENVAIGNTVEHAEETLVASPLHFANMVDPEFTHIGVGVVSAGGRTYVAQEFMQLSAPVAPAPTPPATAVPAPVPPPPAPTPPVAATTPAPAADPGGEATPPTTAPAVAPTPALPAPRITPVTHLGTPEAPDSAEASRAASTWLSVVVLLVVAGALADWARPGRGRRAY